MTTTLMKRLISVIIICAMVITCGSFCFLTTNAEGTDLFSKVVSESNELYEQQKANDDSMKSFGAAIESSATGTKHLDSALQKVASGTGDLDNGLISVAKGTEIIYKALQNVDSATNTLKAKLKTLSAGATSVKNNIDSIQQALDQAIAAQDWNTVSYLSAQLKQLSAGAGQVAAGIGTENDSSATSVFGTINSLSAGIEQITAGTKEIVNAYGDSETEGTILNASHQLVSAYGDTSAEGTILNGSNQLVAAYGDSETKDTIINASSIIQSQSNLVVDKSYQLKSDINALTKEQGQTVLVGTVPTNLTNVTSGVKLSWNKVDGASGYYIYRNNQKVTSIKKGSVVSYIDTGAKTNGTQYQYNVYAYDSDGKPLSSIDTIYYISTPAISKLTPASKSFKATWKKNTTATGYQLQYALNNKFSGAKTTTIKKNSFTSATISKLSSKKKYYVRIRTYKTTNGATYYSAWSAAKTVTTK